KAVDEYAALERLYCMLLRSVREKMYGLGEVSIGFSGGLDSSILAALAKKFSVKVLLISVGLEGSKEVEWAEKTANIMGLPLKAETYAPEDVEETLPKVLWLIEEANALKASIFIPIYWVAEISSKLNSRVMLSGQGSDELFAGYHKYLRDFGISPDCVVRATYGDVLRLHENTLEAEEKVCSFHGVDVRFPYVDYELASFALSLPITLKIASQDDPLRKRILRSLAKHIGLPEEIYLKPKRAIQYGTGVNRALKRIAKKKGLSMQSLINKVFSEVRRHENGSSIFA
ncbi:MAG: asparagine synthase C-terminal domain-containing protein, partial [Candidatus Bathyarchaeia archaeon]